MTTTSVARVSTSATIASRASRARKITPATVAGVSLVLPGSPAGRCFEVHVQRSFTAIDERVALAAELAGERDGSRRSFARRQAGQPVVDDAPVRRPTGRRACRGQLRLRRLGEPRTPPTQPRSGSTTIAGRLGRLA